MNRRLAALLICAPMAFGQPPEPRTRYVDFLAVDAAGMPVADLVQGDLELLQAGDSRKITELTHFNTRNLIAIVDDLGLPAEGLATVRGWLRGFVKDQLAPGERMAVVRTSSGSGVLQQLTDDRQTLSQAIDGLSFLGGSVAERTASGAAWLALRHALQGLQQLPGRKVVVVFSQNLRSIGRQDQIGASLPGEANAAMAGVYAVDPRGAVNAGPAAQGRAPLEELARQTGAIFGAEFPGLLQAERSCYVLGFEESPRELIAANTWDEPVELKVRRAGVTLRAHSRSTTMAAGDEFLAPPERGLQIRRALASPFQGSDIHVRITSSYAGFAGQSAGVEAALLIDVRDLGVIRDTQGVHRAAVRITVDASSDQGGNTAAVDRSYDLALPAAGYEAALRSGLVYSVALRLPAPGVWRVRAVVSDGVSDRLGTAVQTIEVPVRSALAMSGVSLRVYDPGGMNAATDPQESEAERIFRRGHRLQVSYAIFNPLANENKEAQVEVSTRLYARGQLVFSGGPSLLTYPVEPGVHRMVTSWLALAPSSTPGDYLLEVTLADKSGPPGPPRSVSRFIDFQVRE